MEDFMNPWTTIFTPPFVYLMQLAAQTKINSLLSSCLGYMLIFSWSTLHTVVITCIWHLEGITAKHIAHSLSDVMIYMIHEPSDKIMPYDHYYALIRISRDPGKRNGFPYKVQTIVFKILLSCQHPHPAIVIRKLRTVEASRRAASSTHGRQLLLTYSRLLLPIDCKMLLLSGYRLLLLLPFHSWPLLHVYSKLWQSCYSRLLHMI